jgi:hypothetical protein
MKDEDAEGETETEVPSRVKNSIGSDRTDGSGECEPRVSALVGYFRGKSQTRWPVRRRWSIVLSNAVGAGFARTHFDGSWSTGTNEGWNDRMPFLLTRIREANIPEGLERAAVRARITPL